MRSDAGAWRGESVTGWAVSHRPASTQDTGTTVRPGGHSTDTFIVRFCLPPTRVSPSSSSTGSLPVTSTSSSGTVPPPSSLTLRTPWASATGPGRYSLAVAPPVETRG